MRAIGCLVLSIVLAGCEGFTEPVPDWVANRQPLEACADGVVAAESPEAEAGQACILDAYRSGRGAELVTAGEMETGAPLTSYVRVHENGTLEMFLNLGADPTAPGAWERFRCEALVPTDGVRDPGEGVFTVEGCEMLPIP
jgi:hypothetical protein